MIYVTRVQFVFDWNFTLWFSLAILITFEAVVWIMYPIIFVNVCFFGSNIMYTHLHNQVVQTNSVYTHQTSGASGLCLASKWSQLDIPINSRCFYQLTKWFSPSLNAFNSKLA